MHSPVAECLSLRLSSNFSAADAALSKASTIPYMDWPEAVWEAWISLQHSHGTLDSLNKCLDSIEWERQKVNAKRARVCLRLPTYGPSLTTKQAAEKAAAYQSQQQAAEAFLHDVVMSDAAQNVGADGGAMAVDQPSASHKRKAEDVLGPEDAAKKAKPGELLSGSRIITMLTSVQKRLLP
jgi:hypothetical protein